MNDYIGTGGYGPRVYDWKQNKYPTTTHTFSSPSSSIVFASASIYYGAGWDVNIKEGNPWEMTATLNCEMGGDGVTPITQGASGSFATVKWNLKYDITDKEILHCNSSQIAWIGQLTTASIQALEYDFTNPPKYNETASCFNTNVANSASAVVWSMFTRGFKTIPIRNPVLHKSITMPSNYNLTSYTSNVGRIYSVSTLTTAIGIPSNIVAIMSTGTDQTLTDYGVSIPYLFGWIKQPPVFDTNGLTITVDQDFVSGLWPQNIYGTRL